MSSKNNWKEINEYDLVSVKWMLIIVLTLSVIVQTVAQLLTPSFWLNYQLLAFILATNVGAVILAMMAQHSADKIAAKYQSAFTPEFYQGLNAITKVFNGLENQAQAKNQDLNEEIENLGPRLYGFLFSDRPDMEPPQIEVAPVEPYQDDSELFE